MRICSSRIILVRTDSGRIGSGRIVLVKIDLVRIDSGLGSCRTDYSSI